MSTGIWAAASGTLAQASALDVAANNIANASTPGFRADRTIFRQQLVQAMGNDGTRSLRYALVQTVEPDQAQGEFTRTDRPLDVALTDPQALLVVSTPRGERYTRAGSLQLKSDGTLVTTQGDPLLGTNRQPLRVNPNAREVKVSPNGSLQVDGEDTGNRLLTVTFPNPTTLQKEGQILLRAGPGSGGPRSVTTTLETGVLERSNASAIQSMSDLVTTSRQFEIMTRIMEAFSAADRRAATDIIGQK
jgi:flagellar basal body rod protein FlgG